MRNGPGHTNRHRARFGPILKVAALTVVTALALVACGDADESPLGELQLVGVDFELGSMILTNNGTEPVRTEGLWAYQDGESFEFNIFTIEPRATILFSVRELGGVDPAGGEIALYESDEFSDPQAMLDYVAWGTPPHSGSSIATESGLWGQDDTVETEGTTIILSRTDPSGIGATSWIASSDIG